MIPRQLLRNSPKMPLRLLHRTLNSCLPKSIADGFHKIDKALVCLHSWGEAQAIAEAILAMKQTGPIVECGCFMGGMTAKLSLVCKLTNRMLYVFDSFVGLPYSEVANCYKSTVKKDGKNGKKNWINGCFDKGTLNAVKSNVSKYGSIENCVFVPGFFKDTLPNIDIKPALIFIDVDLIDSARDCIKHLWPKLAGQYFFTHEMWFESYVNAITDNNWWESTMNSPAPKLYGAEHGINPSANDLGYFLKETTI